MKRFWKYDGEYWVITDQMWIDWKLTSTQAPPCPICKEDVNSTGTNWAQNNGSWVKAHSCGIKLRYKQ